MMLKSTLCDDSNVYIFVKGTLIAPNTAVAVATNNNSMRSIYWLHKLNKQYKNR